MFSLGSLLLVFGVLLLVPVFYSLLTPSPVCKETFTRRFPLSVLTLTRASLPPTLPSKSTSLKHTSIHSLTSMLSLITSCYYFWRTTVVNHLIHSHVHRNQKKNNILGKFFSWHLNTVPRGIKNKILNHRYERFFLPLFSMAVIWYH